MHPYVFLPVCGAGLVEIERTFPWSSYRSRGPRGSAVCPLRWCRLEPHSNSQYQGLLGSLGTPVYNHLPISTIKEHLWGPALFLPPPWGSLSHGPWGGPLAALFQLWDEVAPPPGEMLLLWGSTTFQNPFCSRSCSGQLSVFLGCWIFLAAFIGPWLCLATSQDGLGCPLELAKHPSQNTEGSTSVLATPSETSFPQCPPTRSTLSRIPSISSKVPLGSVKVWSLSHESCGDSKTFGNRRRRWHPTAVLLPGKSRGRRSLVGCSPWGR